MLHVYNDYAVTHKDSITLKIGSFFYFLNFLTLIKIRHKVGQQTSGRQERSNSNLISYLNCYEAGIFFATCILHMLPEISDKMKNEILVGIVSTLEIFFYSYFL